MASPMDTHESFMAMAAHIKGLYKVDSDMGKVIINMHPKMFLISMRESFVRTLMRDLVS